MATTKPSSERTIALNYESIRNLTSPEEKLNGARSYFANLPARELLKLDTEENLRGYVPEHPGKRRTQVHKAIAQTLEDNPDRFIQYSGGVTVSATDIDVDDTKKTVRVKHGSIINGAQTQGEIKRFFKYCDDNELQEPTFHVRVEFIVEPDHNSIVATAIARNTSTNVQRISMAGKKRYFDDLNASFRSDFPEQKLSMSETDTGDEFVDTVKVLQVLWAMMPEDLLPPGKSSVAQARLKSYKNRAYCLVDFESDVVAKEDGDPKAAARYAYFVDMAGVAWQEYLKWRHHEGWNGQRLRESNRQVIRSDDAITASDGLIFPIVAAMSNFVTKRGKKWVLSIPPFFDEEEMIVAARDQLKSHGGNPMHMGRDSSSYDTLALLPKMVLRVADRLKLK
jgi:hypothetical protein